MFRIQKEKKELCIEFKSTIKFVQPLSNFLIWIYYSNGIA